MRGANDPADLDHEAADLRQHLLALDGVGLDDPPLTLVETAGLVDDLLRDGDLADVVQQRAELDVRAAVVVQAQGGGDVEREADDALAVFAGVGVVGLDDVAEEERRALVGVVQLGQLLEALVALAREDAHQQEQRRDQHTGHSPWPAARRRRRPAPGPRGRRRPRRSARPRATSSRQRDSSKRPVAHGGGDEVEGELRRRARASRTPTRPSGRWTSARTRTRAGPARTSCCPARSAASSARSRREELAGAMPSASATRSRSGTTATGRANSIGTNTACVGTVKPAPTSKRTLLATAIAEHVDGSGHQREACYAAEQRERAGAQQKAATAEHLRRGARGAHRTLAQLARLARALGLFYRLHRHTRACIARERDRGLGLAA